MLTRVTGYKLDNEREREKIIMDYLMMGIVMIFLVFLLTYKAKVPVEGNLGFFDKDNTAAMRGFWCLIVILVHVPEGFQNSIQDMIGSFAYIGVTFFFMTSGYGIALGRKKQGNVRNFWKKRLPKMLIPNLIINILVMALYFVMFREDFTWWQLIEINIWVRWILFCYLAFWIGHAVTKNYNVGNIITVVLIIAMSLGSYYLKYIGVITATIWPTEILGFIWGMLLCSYKDGFKEFSLNKWWGKVVIACVLAGVIGVAYLKFKSVIFVGEYLLKVILGIAILAFMLVLNTKIAIGNKVAWFIGSISFEVYLSHYYVFRALSESSINFSSGTLIVVGIICTLIVSFVVYYVANKVIKLVYKIPVLQEKSIAA